MVGEMSAIHAFSRRQGTSDICSCCGLPERSRLHEQPLSDTERAYAAMLGQAAAEDMAPIIERCAVMTKLDTMPGIKPGWAAASIRTYLEIVRRTLDDLEAGKL